MKKIEQIFSMTKLTHLCHNFEKLTPIFPPENQMLIFILRFAIQEVNSTFKVR